MINVKDIVKAVREIAAEDPDYRYNPHYDPEDMSPTMMCSYINNMDGEPGGCIVGRAMRAVGVPKSRLLKAEGVGVMSLLIDFEDDHETYEYSIEEAAWLREVQNAQDTGETWGEAVTAADSLFKV